MNKVYLKYNDVNPIVECDFGVVYQIIILGLIYPCLKKDFYNMMIIFVLKAAISVFMFILFDIPYCLFFMIIMFIIINILYAYNYNSLVIQKLIKLGYYPADHESSEKLIRAGLYFRL